MQKCEFCGYENAANELVCAFCGKTLSRIADEKGKQEGPFEHYSATVEEFFTSLADPSRWSARLGTIESVGSLLSSTWRHSRQERISQDSGSRGNESEITAAVRDRLWLAADLAFSRLSIEAKIRFFTWLLPVARFDRVIDKSALSCIYSLFAIANLPDGERQNATLSLFLPETLPEPQGNFEAGGKFERLWYLFYAIELAGPYPSEKAERFIAKLAREEGFSEQGIVGELKKLEQHVHFLAILEKLSEGLKTIPIPFVAIPSGFVEAASSALENTLNQQSADKMDLVGLKVLVLADLLKHDFLQEASKLALQDKTRLPSIRERQLEFLRRDSAAFAERRVPNAPAEVCEAAQSALRLLLEPNPS